MPRAIKLTGKPAHDLMDSLVAAREVFAIGTYRATATQSVSARWAMQLIAFTAM